MRTTSLNNKGFAPLLLLVAVVAVLVVGGGVYVYRQNHKAKASVSTTGTVSKTAPRAGTKSTATSDPYAGWKQYCSTYGGVCFKYPADWTTSEGQTSIADVSSLTVTSPTGKVKVEYSPADQGIGGACDPTECFFNTLSLDKPLASNASNLEIVRGMSSDTSTNTIVPFYYVTSSSQVTTQGLIVGKNVGTGLLGTEFPNPKVESGIEHIQVWDTANTSYTSASDAQSWFSNAEVVTAGKILSTVTYQ
jgi:hypothetical protein